MHIVRTKNRKTVKNFIQTQHLATLSNIVDQDIIKARKELEEKKRREREKQKHNKKGTKSNDHNDRKI